jgi:hypothetical protein
MDWKRIRMERRGGTFTLPIVIDTRMTTMRIRLRRMEMAATLLRVMSFIGTELMSNDKVPMSNQFQRSNVKNLWTLTFL